MDEERKKKIHARLSKVVTCQICGKQYQVWNTSAHKKSKFHKTISYCKKKMIDLYSGEKLIKE